jgi:hypothetical protein
MEKLDNPEAVNRAIAGFLDRVELPAGPASGG